MKDSRRFVIVGAGFAGASTASALAQLGTGPGVVLEREAAIGVHASGRNAGLLKISEDDSVIRTLAVRTSRALATIAPAEQELVRRTGGLTLCPAGLANGLDDLQVHLQRDGVPSERLAASGARDRFSFLRYFASGSFDATLWCPDEGVVDVHALLTHYLRTARAVVSSFARAAASTICWSRAAGWLAWKRLQAPSAPTSWSMRPAWAGRLGRAAVRLPLQPMRRHLFVSGRVDSACRDWPFVWVEGANFYWRGEGDGLLLSPCDETPAEPGLPSRIRPPPSCSPGSSPAMRRGWAISRSARPGRAFRTFAPDRRPIIGADRSSRPVPCLGAWRLRDDDERGRRRAGGDAAPRAACGLDRCDRGRSWSIPQGLKESGQQASSACWKSRSRSRQSSTPMDRRTNPSVTP
jgi:D-arginine dehydrogenase